MKKIGIITIPDYNNYGNRLQNFAVKHFFSEMGYTVDTLEMNDRAFAQYRLRQIKLLLKKCKLRAFVHLFVFANGKWDKVKRYKKFEAFTDAYLNVKYYPCGTIKRLQKTAARYDYVVLGSDQIWHPTVNTTPTLFFAKFVQPQKVLFFAPSFGLETLPKAYARQVQEGLADKEHLTVREASGQAIIDELLGKHATVLPDPTLCVHPDVWKGMAKPVHASKPYVLKYFLGNESEAYKQACAQMADRCESDTFVFAKQGTDGYTTGPQEFLGAILDAQYVVTDSFHAVAFCILFQKPFTVFSRLNEKFENEGLDSRLDVLLQTFHMENRKFSPDATCEIGDVDTVAVAQTLQKIRNDTAAFFKNILKD